MDERCNGGSPQGALLALLARLLFLENSRPVHRVLLACVRQLPPRLLALFAHAFERQACTRFTSHMLACLDLTRAKHCFMTVRDTPAALICQMLSV